MIIKFLDYNIFLIMYFIAGWSDVPEKFASQMTTKQQYDIRITYLFIHLSLTASFRRMRSTEFSYSLILFMDALI